MRVGMNEMLVILAVVLIIFGPKNLPKLGKMFGKTMKGFKEGIGNDEAEENGEEKTAETKKTETKGSDEE